MKNKKETQENNQPLANEERAYIKSELSMYVLSRINKALDGVSASFIAELMFLDTEELLDIWELLMRIEKSMPTASTAERLQALYREIDAARICSFQLLERIANKARENKGR